MGSNFASRVERVIDEHGRLCVGIDPHASLLSLWDLPDSGAGVREFGLRVVDAVAGRAGFVKPQVAFFERHGAAGYLALEEVIRVARTAGLVVIADGKRGDIGSTVDAYGEAWLTPGRPLEVDALTTVAYQGAGSLSGVLDRAEAAGKGVFVLGATSNPDARSTQAARRDDGLTVASGIVRDGLAAASGTIGFVFGATVRLAEFEVDDFDLAGVPVLAPGFGEQGGRLSELSHLFGAAAPTTIANVSRSVLGAGPRGLAAAIDRASEEVRA